MCLNLFKLRSVVRFSTVALTSVAAPVVLATPPTVIVTVDMDGSRPGMQHTVSVPAGTTRVDRITVWVSDASATAHIFGVGYLGGLDRSLAFGHVDANNAGNTGRVVAIDGVVGAPIVAGNDAFVTPFTQPLFAGPEVQYVEWGEAGGTVAADPTDPIMHVSVELEDAETGDTYRFYLGDNVVVWTGGTNGLFSTQTPWSLDTGGDHVPDGTPTVAGVDADTPIAVPPGAFLVDFQDGPAGDGATIVVVAACGDFDGDGDVDLTDFAVFAQCFGGPNLPPPGTCPSGADADCDDDGDVDLSDFSIFAQNFTGSQ